VIGSNADVAPLRKLIATYTFICLGAIIPVAKLPPAIQRLLMLALIVPYYALTRYLLRCLQPPPARLALRESMIAQARASDLAYLALGIFLSIGFCILGTLLMLFDRKGLGHRGSHDGPFWFLRGFLCCHPCCAAGDIIQAFASRCHLINRARLPLRPMAALGQFPPICVVPRFARCPQYPENRHQGSGQYLPRSARRRRCGSFHAPGKLV
jgi:hypothetical protein